MERNPVINVLVIADRQAEGEQLLSILRRDGLRLHAEAVRGEDCLRDQLARPDWHLLILSIDAQQIPHPVLFSLCADVQQDLACVAIGNLHAWQRLAVAIPQRWASVTLDDPHDGQQCQRLLRTIHQELDSLRARRQLRVTRAGLRELQQRHQLLLDSASDAVAYLHEGLHVYANQAYAKLFGFTLSSSLQDLAFLDLVDDDDLETVRLYLREGDHPAGSGCLFRRRTGQQRAVSGTPLQQRSMNQPVMNPLVMNQVALDQLTIEQSSVDRIVAQQASILLPVVTAQASAVQSSERASSARHSSERPVTEKPAPEKPASVSPASERQDPEAQARGASDTRERFTLTCALTLYEEERCLQIIVRPAVGNAELLQHTRALQNRDLVTDLLSWSVLQARIEQAIADAVYEGRSSTVILVQLPGPEDMVLSAGKSTANLLLADAARVIRDLAPKSASAGRCTESELVLLLADTTGTAQEPLLTRLNDAMGQLLPAGSDTPRSAGDDPPPGELAAGGSASGSSDSGSCLQIFAGLAAINELSADANEVLTRARQNLTARRRNSTTPNRQDPAAASDSTQLLQRVTAALAGDRVILSFQPIVSFKADGLKRFEVRIRLQENDTTLLPAAFLTLANQHGLGERLDCAVISRVLALLQRNSDPGLRLTINLTANSIASARFLPWLQHALHDHRQSGDRIVLQLSELDIVNAPDLVRRFCLALQPLHIAVSVSHFGGSLNPFRHLPQARIEYIALESTLVGNGEVDLRQSERLENIIAGLHASGHLVMAPMVEKISQLPGLWQSHVNLVQGNCLQEPSERMQYCFVRDEEITLDSPP